MYKLVVLKDHENVAPQELDRFTLSDEEAAGQPFGVNPVGALQVNLGARGLHLYAAGTWSRVKLLPLDGLKVVE